MYAAIWLVASCDIVYTEDRTKIRIILLLVEHFFGGVLYIYCISVENGFSFLHWIELKLQVNSPYGLFVKYAVQHLKYSPHSHMNDVNFKSSYNIHTGKKSMNVTSSFYGSLFVPNHAAILFTKKKEISFPRCLLRIHTPFVNIRNNVANIWNISADNHANSQTRQCRSFVRTST